MVGLVDDFDARLRRDLAEAAGEAPEFTGLRQSRGRSHRSRVLLVAASTALVMTAAGAALWANVQDDPGVIEAQCPSTLKLGGRTYHGHGEMLRRPRPGKDLGAGLLLGCEGAKDESAEVFALPGADPGEAVLASDKVWVADTVDSLPPAVAELEQPVACEGTGTTTIAGDWTAVEGSMPERDYEVKAPYRAVLVADEGDRLPLQQWRQVTVTVRVTPQTAGGDDAALAKDALAGTSRVSMTVRCDGKTFVAESLSRAD